MTAIEIDQLLAEGIDIAELSTRGLAVESLFDPVSPDNPCGEDLSDEPEFTQLNRLTEPKAKTLADPDSEEDKIPEPDWQKIALIGLRLLQKSKDLRVAVNLTSALFNLYGFPGLRDGLAVIRRFVEQFWEGLHPQVEFVRLLALQPLQAPEALADAVKKQPLVNVPSLGKFTLQDVDLAFGKSPPDSAPKRETIEAAFKDGKLEDLQANSQAIDAALEHLTALWTHEKTASSKPKPDYLMSALQRASKLLEEWLGKRIPKPADKDENNSLSATDKDAPAASPNPTNVLTSRGNVNNRNDAIKLLDQVCDYFEHYEPSSPVPLLLRRAQRLVTMDFMDIVRDLAPAGLPQAETIRGPENEKASSGKSMKE